MKVRWLLIAVVALFAVGALTFIRGQNSVQPSGPQPAAQSGVLIPLTTAQPPAVSTTREISPTRDMHSQFLPNSKLTPGDTLAVIKSDICVPGYATKVRNVPESTKKEVYAEYAIVSHAPGAYEVDHLISLELGGSNSVRNLWPESYSGPWNAHIKDKLENHLHSMVCKDEISLPDAQHAIATDWIAAYQKYIGQK